MTTAIAVAAALGIAFSFALGSLMCHVDGATLRRWRLSRRWDVSRLAREFIAAADEPLATLRGLKHMINAWERGARKPSERYWLLYLRVFPECVHGESANGGQRKAAELPGIAGINAMGTPAFSPADSVEPGDVRGLTARVRKLEQQIARLSSRLEEMSFGEDGDGQPRERNERRKTRPGYWRWTWTPLLVSLVSP